MTQPPRWPLAHRSEPAPARWLVRPSRRIEVLLHAALDARPAALAAWRWWRERTGGDAAVAERRLLPLVWWNLGGPDSEDRAVRELSRWHTEAWGRFQQLQAWAGEAVVALRDAAIPSLLLKGLPLAVLHYERPGLRPMADVDLLVAPDARHEAGVVLAKLGYEPLRYPPGSALSLMHSVGHARPRGGSIDLHWYAVLECCYAGVDDDLWANAVPCPFGEVQGAAPDPSAMLLTVCAHGVRWSPGGAVAWIADAMTIVRRCGAAMQWDSLVRAASKRRLSYHLAAALDYLATEFGAVVPADVIEQLVVGGRGRWERLELRLRQRPPAPLSGALLHWFVHRRRVDAGVASPGALSFGGHLKATWGLSSLWQVPGSAAGRAWRRTRAALFRRQAR